MNNSEEKLGNAPLNKLVWSLAIPATLAQLVNLLYSIVDRVFIGHIAGHGAMALTGVGLCTPIILVVSAFSAFAGNGGAPLAAIELGRENRDGASRIMSASVTMLGFFTVALMALLYTFKLPLLRFFGASDATIGYADDYISIYLAGTVFVLFALGMNMYISCQGQARPAMLSVIIGAVCNLILDPVLIYGLGMGVKGAALATVISQGISAFWVMGFLLSGRSVIKILPKYLKPQAGMIGRIAALGVSPFVMNATESLISMVFTNGLQSYGGDLYVGTYTVLLSALQLVSTPIHGFAYGVQPIISYNYGAGNFGRIKGALKITAAVCLIYAVAFFGLVLAAPETIAGMFTSDRALIELSASKMAVFLVGMIPMTGQMCAQISFLGMGKARISLFIACLRKVILITPLALALPRLGLGVDGIYLAEPISDTISAVTAVTLFLNFAAKNLKTVEK